MFLSGVANSFGNVLGGFFGDSNGSPLQGITNPSQWWDYFKNGRTNEVNQQIAEENLGYQRERNAIEDARYEEERDYQRALQERMFEREDTSYLRQAEQLSSLGINPASQQLNGAGAGQDVSSTAPVHGAVPEHNDFQMQDQGILSAFAPLASLVGTINQVATGVGQRDLLQSQIDKQNLDNYITAVSHGLRPEFMKGYKGFNESDGSGNMWFNSVGYDSFNKRRLDNQNISIGSVNLENLRRELKFRKDNNFYESAPDITNKLNYLVSDSFFDTAERALTKSSQLFDKAMDKFDKGNKKPGFNPFSALMNWLF